MNGTLKKILTWFVFPVIIVILTVVIVESIKKPVKFNKNVEYRSEIGIQRLKDLRELEVAYKSVYARFSANADTLRDFYENGQMTILMQIGSSDDSVAVAHTEQVKKANPRITKQELYQKYLAGDKNLVFTVDNKIAVKEALFTDRENFVIDSIFFIPFSGGEPTIMADTVKMVSGVQVPLFEAKMPYKKLLKGLDNQLRINLDAEKRDQNRYEGLMVGSIENPNNNAGNWE